MSVLAFLSEPFSKFNDKFYSQKASLNFVKACFGDDVVVVGRVIDKADVNVNLSSVFVPEGNFEEIYNYSTILDFLKQVLKNPIFLYKYIKRCDRIIEKHNDIPIWVRNPSIGCLIFTLRALRKNKYIYNHMCANAMNAWDNDKYKGILRLFAYIFSFFLRFLVIKVVSNRNVINLCTGKELEDFCLRYNKKTYQLIDSNIKCFSSKQVKLTKPFKYIYIGRIQEDKGISKLLAEFVKLDSDLFSLDILGDGDIYKQLKNKYEKNNIRFHGQVDNANLSNYIENAHALIVPSNNKYEGFPRVILEGWSHSLPVIVSNVGGVKAFVVDGENGLIFDWSIEGQLLELMKRLSDPVVYSYMHHQCARMRIMTTESYWVDKFKAIKNEH